MNKITVKLTNPKTCSCGKVHMGFVEGKISSGYVWFNCSCHSTNIAPLEAQIRKLMDSTCKSRAWVQKAAYELGIAVNTI